MRVDGRNFNQVRSIQILPGATRYAEGSVLIEFGNTRVLCNASVESNVPKWLQGSGSGWVTAEYSMLPRATHTRADRSRSFSGGRAQEISRLIGRSLRAGVNLKGLGDRLITVDCDVLQADGGTRTAAITGGFVALALALQRLVDEGLLNKLPLLHYITAVSVGQLAENLLLDLCYEEDSAANADLNVVMADFGKIVEIQGTAEGQPFARQDLTAMLDLAQEGCAQLIDHQRKVIGDFFSPPGEGEK